MTRLPRWLAALALLACVLAGCSHGTHAYSVQEVQGTCGPELSDETIVEIVKAAVRVSGGDPTFLEINWDLKISAEGCDYVVSGVRKPATTTDYLVLRIGRSGEIKSWPWCCEPAFWVPPPKPADQETLR